MNIRMHNLLDLSTHAQNVDPYWRMKAEAEDEAKRLRDIAEAEMAEKAKKAAALANTIDSIDLVEPGGSGGSDDSDNSLLATPTLAPAPTTPEATPKEKNRKEPKPKKFGPRKLPALGLARLAAHYLSYNLPKPKAVSRSNWEMNPLTERQLICEYILSDYKY